MFAKTIQENIKNNKDLIILSSISKKVKHILDLVNAGSLITQVNGNLYLSITTTIGLLDLENEVQPTTKLTTTIWKTIKHHYPVIKEKPRTFCINQVEVEIVD